MPNEIESRADELRAAASTCDTRAQFRRKYPDWPMECINHAISTLGLTFKRDGEKTGPAKIAQACPKPKGKS